MPGQDRPVGAVRDLIGEGSGGQPAKRTRRKRGILSAAQAMCQASNVLMPRDHVLINNEKGVYGNNEGFRREAHHGLMLFLFLEVRRPLNCFLVLSLVSVCLAVSCSMISRIDVTGYVHTKEIRTCLPTGLLEE